METGRISHAVFWYELALTKEPDETSGGFIRLDVYGYRPAIQLCVCYDRLNNRKRAIEYNEMAAKLKPGDPSVEYNRKYFSENNLKSSLYEMCIRESYISLQLTGELYFHRSGAAA